MPLPPRTRPRRTARDGAWRALLFLACTGPAGPAFAQSGTAAAQVQALPDDTAKVLLLSDLCFAHRRTAPDSAEAFGQAALRLARKLNFPRGEAQACNDLAILRIDRSDFPQADTLLRRSLRLRTLLHDSAGMAAVHNKLGIIHQARLMLEEALEEDLKALAIYERIGPPMHEATLLNNIGILQFNLGRLPAALATHRRAAAIRASIPDSTGLASSYSNMANVEMQMGDTAAAIGHYRQAIAYFREKGMGPERAVSLHNLANIRMARGQLDEAARNYAEALALRTEVGEQKGIASSLIGLGGTRLRQGRLAEAGKLLHQGLALGRKTGSRSEEMQAMLDLARLHAKLDHGDSSFLYHQGYVALKDSVFNADMSTRLAQAEARFEAEKKERRIQAQRAMIAELERQNDHRKLWLVTAMGGLGLAVLGALLLMQVQRRRARARHDAAIIGEREAGLRGVLEATEKERKRIARELHDGIGQQVAGLKFRLEEMAGKAADDQPVRRRALSEAVSIAGDVGREVRGMAHALMPRALEHMGLATAAGEMLDHLFGGTGTTHSFMHHGMQERLPPEMETSLYRIIQELVQNTLKHADARNVHLQLMRSSGNVVLIYEDDGQGLPAGGEQPGIGLRNIRERIHALHGKFSIGNGQGQGIVATVRVPWRSAAETA